MSSMEEEGEIKAEEKKLIHNIFELDDTNASEIMTPRADMFVIEADDKIKPEEIIQSGYTRIPVIDGNIDNITEDFHSLKKVLEKVEQIISE